jgi:hypothetical protein
MFFGEKPTSDAKSNCCACPKKGIKIKFYPINEQGQIV